MGAMVAEPEMEDGDGWSTERLRNSTKERLDSHQKRLRLHSADEVVVHMLDFFDRNQNGGKGVNGRDGVQV